MATSIDIQDTQLVSPVDALWTLIQGQSKAVQKALMHRLEALYPSKSAKSKIIKTDEISPQQLESLEKAREEIRRGECITVHSKEELDNFLAAL